MCVCRAIAIASERPYIEVHDRLRRFTGRVRHSRRKPSPENGINTGKRRFGDYMDELGFMWVGSTEIPMRGRIVVEVCGHAFAMINGVIHDTHKKAQQDASRILDQVLDKIE